MHNVTRWELSPEESYTLETADPNELELAAETYRGMGWDCVSGDGKRPNIKGWPEQLQSPEEFADGLMRAKEPALCVKMGEPSNLVDFEWDSLAQFKALCQLFRGELPPTLLFDSNHGGHLLFSWDSRLAGRHTISLPCEDGSKLIIRCGHAAQSVFPPSRHKRWRVGPNDGVVLPMPEYVVETLQAAKPEPVQSESQIERGTCGDIENAVSAMLRIKPKVNENDGSSRLYAYACRAVDFNLTDEQAVAAVRYCEQLFPFPAGKSPTDAGILKRVEDAENKGGVQRGQALLFPELTPWANEAQESDVQPIKSMIDIDQTFESVVEQTEKVLASTTYQRGNFLVRVDEQPEQCPLAVADNGAPKIVRTPRGALIEPVARAARFIKYDGRKKAKVETLPPAALLSCLYDRGYYPSVPVLNAVVERPFLLRDGTIVSDPGYDPGSGIFLIERFDFPGLMSTDEAVSLLLNLFADFPFREDSDRSAVLAHGLTLTGRNAIDGATPNFNVEGNRPGCGKGLSLDAGSMAVEGRIAPKYPGSCGDDELRKVICSIALSGQSQFVLDNVKGQVGGPVLESSISSCRYNGRMLGYSEEVDLPLNVTWAMTSNGVVFTRDMARRTVTIGMETDNPTPHLRDDFEHPNLLEHVRANRPKLYVAYLSILANHLRADCPDHGRKPMGSFEAWDRLVRRAIIGAGLADPLTAVNAEEEDVIEPEIAALHKSWPFTEPKTVKQVLQAVEADPQVFSGLKELIDSSTYGNPSHFLGQLLRKSRGLVVDGVSFDRTSHQAARWFLVGTPEVASPDTLSISAA